MSQDSPLSYRLSLHAVSEMQRRGISDAEVAEAMHSPEAQGGYGNRSVRQAVVNGYLIRVVVEAWHQPPVVVTVYRTSKLSKYGASP